MTIMENYFNWLPVEIIVGIFEYVPLNDLINLTLVEHYFRTIIKSTRWKHLMVKLSNTKIIEHVIKNYKFIKYDFSYTKITNENVKLLGKCHTLYLSYCPSISQSIKNELRKTVQNLYY